MSSEWRGPEAVRETTGDLRAALAEMKARSDREKERADRLAAELAYLLDQMPVTSDGTVSTGPLPVVRRGAGGGHRRDRHGLRIVPGFVLAALWPLRHALRHSTAAKAIAAHKLAATLTVAAVGVGVPVAAVVTVHTLAPSASAGSFADVPAPAASVYGASPVDAVPVAALTRPKAGTTDAKRARLAEGGILPVLPAPSVQSPPSSQPATQPSQAPSSAPAGAAVLSGIPSALDLSVFSQATVVLTATGGTGWVSWQVTTTGTDLDFSKTSGVLSGGQSYSLTVGLDPAQDGATSQTFTVGGQQVTVTLPAPVPTPSPAATDTPSDLPSFMPTPDPGSS